MVEKHKKWSNPRKIHRCQCDFPSRRSITSRKCGVYKVYSTLDRIILKCPLCQEEQSYKIVKEKIKKSTNPYPEIAKK